MSGDHTLDEAFAAFKATGKLPEWVKEFGGPNARGVVLEPGSYALICFIPDMGDGNRTSCTG